MPMHTSAVREDEGSALPAPAPSVVPAAAGGATDHSFPDDTIIGERPRSAVPKNYIGADLPDDMDDGYFTESERAQYERPIRTSSAGCEGSWRQERADGLGSGTASKQITWKKGELIGTGNTIAALRFHVYMATKSCSQVLMAASTLA